jgi:aminomethyltransferase
MQERAVPRHDYEIVDGTGAVIGIVTSGTMSPSMNKGMDWVMLQSLTARMDIFIFVYKNDVAAKVVKLPFYKK